MVQWFKCNRIIRCWRSSKCPSSQSPVSASYLAPLQLLSSSQHCHFTSSARWVKQRWIRRFLPQVRLVDKMWRQPAIDSYNFICLITLDASSGKLNVCDGWSGVHPFVCPLSRRDNHHDSPGEACSAASVHFSPTMRTDIPVPVYQSA